MTAPTSISSAIHYLWGDGCDGWHLLQAGHLSVIQEHIPPGKTELRHYHAQSHQFFYILEGEATMRLAEGEVVLKKGEGLEIPPGVPHQFCNFSAAGVDFLVISAPPAHADRVDG